ncbi:cell cycle checkpoint protein RAD17 [Coccinella septempunctata]|uniref:cell cycle checkpoint protein RAD17 n=1 Tax=Coccinella septempunctata TaxID=41139 RepID=UPI001D07D42A|nr:cell cycle checkpoint protein RAD17 [Coccinella septempunctata]
MKKSANSWKSFDFGPEKVLPKKRSSITQTSNTEWERPANTKNNYSQKKSFDFFAELSPRDVSDLAVHSKKIEEVKFWLEKVFNDENGQKSFLLLSGPTGSGKTATLNVLCKSMGISISEWINPVDQDFELLRGPNQANKFLEFLTTESNYTSLFDISSSKRIVLVEDFPNIFIKQHEEFANILDECHYKSKHPIVFICTEVANNRVNLVYNLFPQEILVKYGIAHISFNACAPTLLKTALRRAHDIVQKNKDLFQTPSSKLVDAILSSSMGDIRCAISQYYFASLLGSKEMPTEKNITIKTGMKRKRTEKSSSIKIMAKDETLGLFHALGRVLNPKRTDNGKLNCDFDSLITELQSQPENTVSFLFTNYIKYFGDLRECQEASEFLSFSQKFFDKWTERNDLHVYPLWISILGLMSVNNHKVSKWNQIEGPKKMQKKIIRNQETLNTVDEFYASIIRKSCKDGQFLC